MADEDGEIIEELPVGTLIEWTDGAGRSHEAEVVEWPDRPLLVEGVKVVETIVSVVPHILASRRRVKVIEPQ